VRGGWWYANCDAAPSADDAKAERRPGPDSAEMAEIMKLTLEAGQLSPSATLPLEVQSISPSGLAVLTAACAPADLDKGVLGDRSQSGEALTFVLEKDGRSLTLRASLVWVELSSEPPTGQRLELIVDTGDQPGWWEVQSALAGG
jgi:hypothetical protein